MSVHIRAGGSVSIDAGSQVGGPGESVEITENDSRAVAQDDRSWQPDTSSRGGAHDIHSDGDVNINGEAIGRDARVDWGAEA